MGEGPGPSLHHITAEPERESFQAGSLSFAPGKPILGAAANEPDPFLLTESPTPGP